MEFESNAIRNRLLSTCAVVVVLLAVAECTFGYEKIYTPQLPRFAGFVQPPKRYGGIGLGLISGPPLRRDVQSLFHRGGGYNAVNHKTVDGLGGQHSVKQVLPTRGNRTGQLIYKITFKGHSRQLKIHFSYDINNRIILDKPQLLGTS